MRRENARREMAGQAVLVNDTYDPDNPSVTVTDEEVHSEVFHDVERQEMRIDQEERQHEVGIKSESEG